MRLFIAIQLTRKMKRALTELQGSMARQGVSGNFTKEENLHLTLAFIGEHKDPEAVLDALQSVPFRPFPLALEGVGRFGDLYWAGLASSRELTGYVKNLRHALAEQGIPFDRKKFSPHITLVRRAVSRHGLPEIPAPKAGMEVTRISLMRSDRGKNGMLYTEIGSVEWDHE